MKRSSAGFSVLPVILVALLVLVVAAAASFGTYRWQHNKVVTLNGNLSGLNTKLTTLNGQIASLSGQVNKTCQSTAQTVQPSPCASYDYTSAKGVSALVFMPAKNATVTNPLAVIGEVPGNWSFEAQFPAQLKDSSGAVVAQATAHVLGNWQTTQLVPYSVQFTYSSTPSGSGTIVLQKDNPSGMTQNADSISLPIKF